MFEAADYLCAAELPLAVFENVLGFMEGDTEFSKSPMTVFFDYLQERGFACDYVQINHHSFAPCVRKRTVHQQHS